MEPVTLRQFIGEPSEFYLAKPNKTFHLRSFCLADALWMEDQFGKEVELNKLSAPNLCRVAFQLMELESKKEFLAKDVDFINEKGELFTKRLGGPELMFWQVVGVQEHADILKALLKSIAGGKVIQEVVEIEEAEKKRLLQLQAGQKSSTFSAPNMAGLPKKSSAGLRAKSHSGSKPLPNGRTLK